MVTCCFCLSPRIGCILGAITLLIISVVNTVLAITVPMKASLQTVVVVNILLLFLAGIVLLIGVLKEDRVCIILFLCFNICAIATEVIGLIMLFLFDESDEKLPIWVMVLFIVEHIPILYMLPIAEWEYKAIKDRHVEMPERYYHAPLAASGHLSGVTF